MTERVVRGRRVVTADGVGAAAVHVRGGRIAAVTAYEAVPSGVPVFEAGDAVVMAGLVDPHVHVNEPGRTDWEGFHSATRAAAGGGITTLVDMPLNSVPATTTPAGLVAKAAAARGACWVDVGFWGGLVPESAGHLEALREAGVLGFKCFLVDSGVAEFPAVVERDLRRALPALTRLGVPLLAHAELPGPLEEAAAALAGADPRAYATYLASRPAEAELAAITLLLDLVALEGSPGFPLHLVHLSTARALPLLRAARRDRLPVTVETCPHYLTFAAEEIPDGATLWKCAPPIRERADREQLWAALAGGEIDLVASDHSPCPPALKRQQEGDFLAAWGGISSLQLALPAVWTGMRERGLPVERLASWMSRAPARLAGLTGRKGELAPGFDADLVVWDPEAAFRVEPEALEHRHPITPYAGRELYGVVEATFLRGEPVFLRGRFDGSPRGRLLLAS